MTASLDLTGSFVFGTTLDAERVDQLRTHLRQTVLAPTRLELDCRQVETIDPVAATLLWLVCRDLQRNSGSVVQLAGINPWLARRLRNHPLQDFFGPGEELFEDPFRSWPASRR